MRGGMPKNDVEVAARRPVVELGLFPEQVNPWGPCVCGSGNREEEEEEEEYGDYSALSTQHPRAHQPWGRRCRQEELPRWARETHTQREGVCVRATRDKGVRQNAVPENNKIKIQYRGLAPPRRACKSRWPRPRRSRLLKPSRPSRTRKTCPCLWAG